MINRYIEIFKNNAILTKQKLESELEMLLNDNTMDIEKKIKKTEKIIIKINDISNVYTTFESYINTTKLEKNGNT
jgi:hypothetical protein